MMELKNKHIEDMTSQMTAHKATIDMVKREADGVLTSEIDKLKNLNLQERVCVIYLMTVKLVQAVC